MTKTTWWRSGVLGALAIRGFPDGATAQDPVLRQSNSCHQPMMPDLPVPDFAFGQHPSTGSVSPDGIVQILMRGLPMNPLARRLNVSLMIVNQRGRDYRATDSCTAVVRITMNEGPGYYSSTSQGATHFEEEDVPPLLQPGVGGRLVTFVVALNGTGPDAPNDWDQDYEHVLLDFAVDPGNTILEADETNNATASYCYHAPTGTFASLKECSAGP